jgi:hypothetical protein
VHDDSAQEEVGPGPGDERRDAPMTFHRCGMRTGIATVSLIALVALPARPGPLGLFAIDEAPYCRIGFREPIVVGPASAAVESLIGHPREMLPVAMPAAVLGVDRQT